MNTTDLIALGLLAALGRRASAVVEAVEVGMPDDKLEAWGDMYEVGPEVPARRATIGFLEVVIGRLLARGASPLFVAEALQSTRCLWACPEHGSLEEGQLVVHGPPKFVNVVADTTGMECYSSIEAAKLGAEPAGLLPAPGEESGASFRRSDWHCEECGWLGADLDVHSVSDIDRWPLCPRCESRVVDPAADKLTRERQKRAR